MGRVLILHGVDCFTYITQGRATCICIAKRRSSSGRKAMTLSSYHAQAYLDCTDEAAEGCSGTSASRPQSGLPPCRWLVPPPPRSICCRIAQASGPVISAFHRLAPADAAPLTTSSSFDHRQLFCRTGPKTIRSRRT